MQTANEKGNENSVGVQYSKVNSQTHTHILTHSLTLTHISISNISNVVYCIVPLNIVFY